MPVNIEEQFEFPEMTTKTGETIEFKYCKRETWGAQPPSGSGSLLQHPVSKVRFAHTKTETCSKYRDCFHILQNLQRVNMEDEKLPDIKFNFLVGGDGTIYEGRGWHMDNDRPPELAHLKGDCLDIGYIGNLDDRDPFKPDFPTIECEKMGYAWAVHGQQDHNYVQRKFSVIQ